MNERLTFKRLFFLLVKILFLIGITVGIFTYAMFQGNFVSWFLFYTVLTLILLIVLYTAIPLGKLELKRSFSSIAIEQGGSIEVKLNLRQRLLFPFLYVSVEDVMEERLAKKLTDGSAHATFHPLIEGNRYSYQYRLSVLKRGQYQLYGTRLSTSDIFGFFKKSLFVKNPEQLLVYPRHHKIENWSYTKKQENESELRAMDFMHDVSSLAGSREYVPGDKLTSIDWKSTARTMNLMTKEFEDFFGQKLVLFLSNELSDLERETLHNYENAIELAASFLVYADRKGIETGLLSIGNNHVFQPGSEHREMMQYLARVQPIHRDPQKLDLPDSLWNIQNDAVLIFITAELNDEFLESLRNYASRYSEISVYLLDSTAASHDPLTTKINFLRKHGIRAEILRSGNLEAHAAKGQVKK